MKKTLTIKPVVFLFFCIAFLQTACTKKAESSTPPPTEITGVKRSVGVANGDAISKTIGSEGGTITFPGNAVTITVPAGALTEPTTISIQSITNTNIAAIGNAFRLTPHGEQFKKPVTITFSYAEVSDSINLPGALGLAYQDSAGVWQFTTSNTVDTVHKTITYSTTHFSDWSMMQWLSLKPIQTSLSEGEEVTIKALYFIPFSQCNCDDDILVPLPTYGPGYPVGDPTPLNKKYIGSWQLAGAGTLIPTTTNEAVYKAPAQIPLNSSATVSLKLKSSHTLILVSNITLLSNSFFEMRINGGNWKPLQVALVQLEPGKLSIATPGIGSETLSMFFPQQKGASPWGEDVNGNIISGFNYFPSGTGPVYICQYEDNEGLHNSDGNITIKELGGVGENVTGTFILNPSGYYSNGKQKSKATIEGRFKLKRAF